MTENKPGRLEALLELQQQMRRASPSEQPRAQHRYGEAATNALFPMSHEERLAHEEAALIHGEPLRGKSITP